MADPFTTRIRAMSPANRAVSVTPSDSTALTFNALYVGGTGDVVVVTTGGDTITFKNVPVGQWLPIEGNRVKAATTATLTIAVWRDA